MVRARQPPLGPILALLLCGLVPAVIGAINVGVYNAASSLFRWRNIVAFAVSAKGRWLHGTAIDIDGGQVDPLRMSRYFPRS